MRRCGCGMLQIQLQTIPKITIDYGLYELHGLYGLYMDHPEIVGLWHWVFRRINLFKALGTMDRDHLFIGQEHSQQIRSEWNTSSNIIEDHMENVFSVHQPRHVIFFELPSHRSPYVCNCRYMIHLYLGKSPWFPIEFPPKKIQTTIRHGLAKDPLPESIRTMEEYHEMGRPDLDPWGGQTSWSHHHFFWYHTQFPKGRFIG